MKVKYLIAKATICAAGLLLGLHLRASAVMIEGVTPAGNIKTVGVSNTGRFLVEITSTTAVQHVIVDSGTVKVEPGSSPISVTAINSLSDTIVESASTINGTGTIYPADSNRKQGIICNTSPISSGLALYLGNTSGPAIYPGGCFSPDTPSSFTGAITGASTTTVNFAYWYSK